MTYNEAIEYIKQNSTNKIVPGLSNIKALCTILGNPQNKIKTIHLAGTNGKGSVGSFIAQGLISSGYNVGRYISPSVLNYRDMLTYNNHWISEDEFAQTVEEIKALIDKSGCKPTVFELETALAFYWLSKKNCDFLVIETGMGGRLDATNVTDKILSVITPISMDHTKFLGNTIEEIATEKAGIIKDITVSANQPDNVKEILASHSSKITFVQSPSNVAYSLDKTVFDYKTHKNVEISMLGKFQVENACLALEVFDTLKEMGYNINNISLKEAQWNCRFQLISTNPIVIIDGAHNPQGIQALKENILLYLKDKKIVFITGVLADKDYNQMSQIIMPLAEKIYTIKSNSPRALSAQDYADTIKQYNPNVTACQDIKSALLHIKEYESAVIFGSLSFMGEIYKILKEDIWKDITK